MRSDKITPLKWIEVEYGDEYWAVGIIGEKVIGFNDFEEGFNVSNYSRYGRIDGYDWDQLQLNHLIQQIFTLVSLL